MEQGKKPKYEERREKTTLPPKLLNQVRAYAERHEMTRSAAIRDIIRNFFLRESSKP